MRRLGQVHVTIGLTQKLDALPEGLSSEKLELAADGMALSFTQKGDDCDDALAALLKMLVVRGIEFRSVNSRRSSLEDIFIELVGRRR